MPDTSYNLGPSLLQHLHSMLDFLDGYEKNKNVTKEDVIGEVRCRVSRSIGAVVQCATVRNFVLPIDTDPATDDFLQSIQGNAPPVLHS